MEKRVANKSWEKVHVREYKIDKILNRYLNIPYFNMLK